MNAAGNRLLAVDVGNTRIKFGVFKVGASSADQLPACEEFLAVLRGAPPPWMTLREWAAGGAVADVVATGSNGRQIAELVSNWPSELPAPRVLMDRSILPIQVDVDHPERVGIDRLLNGIAVNVIRQADEPTIVIDIGTATTVDAVSPDGVFLGGAILAGPELSARALHEYTAVLPMVTLRDLSDGEPSCVGRNTQAAIGSGLYWGHWHAVRGLSVQMTESLGWSPETPRVLTGGAAEVYRDRLPPCVGYEPHLTLQGLAVATRASAVPRPSPAKE